ncbi:hypothetical protein LJ737_07525 [Hymenobacter sp. 15J16-1T3B]|uniref:hypothetical protein n=1 Tax=Hymenobacter sp. 15J16-1T3B TaxID=2886941 RepID=UPI001D1088EB|nr:hypothetical protein [Hymenobacter sp. 15J16-1T3B]MCC3157083.1 hypothetical protein [Hymenobacter sp. 15J16-1T3B]
MILSIIRRVLAGLRWATAHPKTTGGLLAAGTAGWVALCFSLGYQIPSVDRHPSWQPFPALSNPQLVIEKIPDSIFGPRFGHRFPYPTEADTVTHYQTFNDEDGPVPVRGSWELYDDHRSLTNLRSVGFQVTENDFDSDVHFHLYIYPGNSSVTPDEPWNPHFRTFGHEYLELNVGGVKAYFKEADVPIVGTSLDDFYQYNHPIRRQDTLFLRYGLSNTNYAIYVR